MQKTAVFIDAENVAHSKVRDVLTHLEKEGDVVVCHAHADWSKGNLKNWEEVVKSRPITMLQSFHCDKKEVADKALMMDAIDLIHQKPEISVVAIITSDSEFYALALKLRENGKKVIGVGSKEKCLERWINSCNAFFYFEEIETFDSESLLDNAETDDEEIIYFSLETFLKEIYSLTPHIVEKDCVLVARFGETIRRNKPDFNVRKFGYQGILNMIKSYPNIFETFDDGLPVPSYFMRLKEDALEYPSENKVRLHGVVKRFIQKYIIIETDRGDYHAYVRNISKESRGEQLRKGLEVSFIEEKEPMPNAVNLKEKNGRAVDVKIKKISQENFQMP